MDQLQRSLYHSAMTARDERPSAEEASDQFDVAFSAIENDDLETAREIATEFAIHGYSGSFEIEALIAEAVGDLEAGLVHLEQGLKEAPNVWRMWQLQGNFQSELRRFEEAEASYERALNCPGTWRASVVLNQAVVASRKGEHQLALKILETVSDDDMDEDFTEQLMDGFFSLEMSCRRTLRNRVLAEGTVFKVIVDVPVPPNEQDPGGNLRFFQRMHVAAACESDVMPLLQEDLGEEFKGAIIDEISEHEDGAGLLTGIHWIDVDFQVYDADLKDPSEE